jgi:photosystem II stability/assembly factor-like uncharacterized protein
MNYVFSALAAALLAFSSVAGSSAQSVVRASSPHWMAQKSPTNANLADVSCSSASECFAVGANATILKTTNGGKTWRRVTSGYGLAHPNASFASVRCPTSGVCSVIAAPYVVLRTTDGGRSWRKHVFPLLPSVLSGLGHLACPTRLVCFATASPSGNPLTWFTHSAEVFQTTNGGTVWQPVNIPNSVPCPGDCSVLAVGYDLQWISCQSARSCRAGGDTFIGSHEGYSSAVIRTDDGGKTWTLADHSFDPNIATCPTASICTGVFYVPLSPNTGPYLARSTNGGHTWTNLKPITPVLTSIACSGKTFCELAGPKGKLAMATGTGLFVQISPTTNDLDGVACPQLGACYAVGAGGTILARKK